MAVRGVADRETPSKQIPIYPLQMDGVDSSGNRLGQSMEDTTNDL